MNRLSFSFVFNNTMTKNSEVPRNNSKNNRLHYMDRTRGLIMLFMALDHALFFWSNGRISNEGLPLIVNGVVKYNNPGNSSFLSFIVMILASICAPGFLFIAGYVLALSIKRREQEGVSSFEITKHFWKRGLLLVLLQVFIASPAFNLPLLIQTHSISILTMGTFMSLSVLSTIGIGFLYLSLGRHISPWRLMGVSGLLYLISQLFLSGFAKSFQISQSLEQIWQNILVLPVPFSPTYMVNNNFPIIPWLIPLSLGWLYGQTYSEKLGFDYEAKRFALSGFCSLSLFLIFRIAGIGDYLHPDGAFQGFFVLSKYPPSPDYFLLYLGIVFLMLYLFYLLPKPSRIGTILESYGRAPLFFYNIHLWMFALVPLILNRFNRFSMQFGVLIFFIGIVLLYPLCHQYLKWRLITKKNSRVLPISAPLERMR